MAEIFERALTRWGDHVQRARMGGRLDHVAWIIVSGMRHGNRSTSLSDAQQESCDDHTTPPPVAGGASHEPDL